MGHDEEDEHSPTLRVGKGNNACFPFGALKLAWRPLIVGVCPFVVRMIPLWIGRG